MRAFTLTELPTFLVVDDNVQLADGLVRQFCRYGEASPAYNFERGAAAAVEGKWDGIALDLGFPDGDGMDILRDLRSRGRDVAVMVLTGDWRQEVAVEVHALRGHYVPKGKENPVPPFVELALGRERLSHLLYGKTVARMQKQPGVTDREADVLEAAALDSRRNAVAEVLGVRPDTVKDHARSLERKLGVGSIPEAVELTWREVWQAYRRHAPRGG